MATIDAIPLSVYWIVLYLGAIRVLRNAVGGGRVSDFPEKSVTKMYGSTLLALRVGTRWVSNFQQKMLRTLEWPFTICL